MEDLTPNFEILDTFIRFTVDSGEFGPLDDGFG
jgi:hypothetical protein